MRTGRKSHNHPQLNTLDLCVSHHAELSTESLLSGIHRRRPRERSRAYAGLRTINVPFCPPIANELDIAA